LLDDDALTGDDFTQRLLYAGPVHYRITFVEEPPLPPSVQPPDYPLRDVVSLLPTLAQRRAHLSRAHSQAEVIHDTATDSYWRRRCRHGGSPSGTAKGTTVVL
jgi:hypothetical protein